MNRLDNSECLHDFGKYIKNARKKRKLKQADVAEMIGVTQSYYSLVERGERNVDLFFALKICNALNIDLSKFIRQYN